METRFAKGKGKSELLQRLIFCVNRKRWWHVPPRDPGAYQKRGKFLASSYREAEFWGRPLRDSIRVTVKSPLIGDEGMIERRLFGRRMSREDLGIEERWQLDARMKRAALALGYDSILLMTQQGFRRFASAGRPPRSMELNLLQPPVVGGFPR